MTLMNPHTNHKSGEHRVPGIVVWLSVSPCYAWVSWVGEINYCLIEAASVAFTN